MKMDKHMARRGFQVLVGLLLVSMGLIACDGSSGNDSTSEPNPTNEGQALRELLKLPDHFEIPAIPDYNPLTQEKITLGHRLFYDQRLSGNQTQACASCHLQELAFSDGEITPTGSTGHVLVRNSQGLGNAVYHSTLTWSNNGFVDVEDQLKVPILSDNPIELGVIDSVQAEVLARFDSDALYQRLFQEAFPDSESGATINKIVFALASFMRTLVSGDSPYDRFLNGDSSALTEQQVRGLRLFNSEKMECFHCHSGINFSVSYRDSRTDAGSITFPFFNNGLYNVDGEGSYPAVDQGLYDLTLDPRDRGLFRPQSLRNVAVTAPYMHDGSLATLREVIRHYARGGTLTESGPNAGDGRLSPLKSGLIRGFAVTEQEIEDLIAFLEALTDETFINNPDFSNPFEE